MRQLYFFYPFAIQGDNTPDIPINTDPAGGVSYQQGYTYNYQRDLASDSAAKAINRIQFNAVMKDITTALQDLQQNGTPEFIDTQDNQGAGFGYQYGALCRYSANGVPPFKTYFSLIANNMDIPGTSANWLDIGAILSSGRVKLSKDLTLYVSPSGNDSNNGLSASTPFLTMQKAWNTLIASYDLNGYNATISLANGTYNQGLAAEGAVLGLGSGNSIYLLGNNSSPSSCVISTNNQHNFILQGGGSLIISGVTMTASGSINSVPASCIVVSNQGSVGISSNIIFGSATGFHIYTTEGGVISAVGAVNYTITGSAQCHIQCAAASLCNINGPGTITIGNNLNFSTAFINVSLLAIAQLLNLTFSYGSYSVTGTKYISNLNSVIAVNGAGPNYLPGSGAGQTSNGGLYL